MELGAGLGGVGDVGDRPHIFEGLANLGKVRGAEGGTHAFEGVSRRPNGVDVLLGDRLVEPLQIGRGILKVRFDQRSEKPVGVIIIPRGNLLQHLCIQAFGGKGGCL